MQSAARFPSTLYPISILKQANRRILNRRISKGGFALVSLYNKKDRSTTEAHDRQNTLFDVGRSMFDVRCSFFS